ncbi:MAG: hypothetical protein K2Y16_06180 [Burkholderiales bacterium]|nr:hypothetical protein [Burkholderiales bacterium]
MIKTSIPRRLSALLLFAALTLLQVQVALADCLTSNNAAPEAAMACCQPDSGFTGETELDRATLAKLCERFCASPSALKSRNDNYAAPHNTPEWRSARPVVIYASAQSTLVSGWFLNDPPVTHQLIYHLQRLLI